MKLAVNMSSEERDEFVGLTQKEIQSLWDFFESAQNPQIYITLTQNNAGYHSRCNMCNKSGNVQLHTIHNNNNQLQIRSCSRCLINLNNVIPTKSDSPPNIADLYNHLSGLGDRRANQRSIQQTTLREKAEPYIKSGLAESFAIALVKSEKPEEILNLWEAKWWKQYEPDDILITSVLDETLTEQEARIINEFRGEHRALAMACIKKQITTEWAEMLLESGFDEHPDAVLNVLEGADPALIARIRGMEVKDVPPPLGIRILMSDVTKESLDGEKSD
jgi:hypothetical protein